MAARLLVHHSCVVRDDFGSFELAGSKIIKEVAVPRNFTSADPGFHIRKCLLGFIANRPTRHVVSSSCELGLAPASCLLLGAFSICLGFSHSYAWVALWLTAAGFAGRAGLSRRVPPEPHRRQSNWRSCKKSPATYFLSMPTFCSQYTRKCSPDQFATLRYVAVGAEKLRDATANEFKELVMLYTSPSITPADIVKRLHDAGLPPLWIPKRTRSFRRLHSDAWTGKTDLGKARAIAIEKTAQATLV
jgi:hypothetical protein